MCIPYDVNALIYDNAQIYVFSNTRRGCLVEYDTSASPLVKGAWGALPKNKD